MNGKDFFELNNTDPDDIGDTILQIDRSLGLHLGMRAFDNVTTYGDVCDIIAREANRYGHGAGCTTQQAFYKIRDAIANTLLIQKHLISPQTQFESLLPKKGRRKNIRRISEALGVESVSLSMNSWLAGMLFIGFFASALCFFFDASLAWKSLVGFTVISWIANKFNDELHPMTVGGLATKLANKHYIHFRRNAGTINPTEIPKMVEWLFIEGTGVDRLALRKHASLGWK